MLFAVGVEHALDVTVQGPHDADASEHGGAARRRDQDQGLHGGLPFLSLMLGFRKLRDVTPGVLECYKRGSGIGPSNLRFQPRSLMTPTLLVEFGPEPLRRPRCGFVVARVAPRARRAAGAAVAGAFAFPWSIRVTFTHPAAVLAE
jgi:hypothetical protein